MNPGASWALHIISCTFQDIVGIFFLPLPSCHCDMFSFLILWYTCILLKFTHWHFRWAAQTRWVRSSPQLGRLSTGWGSSPCSSRGTRAVQELVQQNGQMRRWNIDLNRASSIRDLWKDLNIVPCRLKCCTGLSETSHKISRLNYLFIRQYRSSKTARKS